MSTKGAFVAKKRTGLCGRLISRLGVAMSRLLVVVHEECHDEVQPIPHALQGNLHSQRGPSTVAMSRCLLLFMRNAMMKLCSVSNCTYIYINLYITRCRVVSTLSVAQARYADYMQQLLYTKQNVRFRAGSLKITNVVISGCNPEQMGISGAHRQHAYGDDMDDAGRFAIQAVRPNKFAGRWILEIVQNGDPIWTGPPEVRTPAGYHAGSYMSLFASLRWTCLLHYVMQRPHVLCKMWHVQQTL